MLEIDTLHDDSTSELSYLQVYGVEKFPDNPFYPVPPVESYSAELPWGLSLMVRVPHHDPEPANGRKSVARSLLPKKVL